MNKNMLRGEMAAAGFTQTKLANEARIPLSSLSAKINGHRQFSLHEAKLLCQALGISDKVKMADIFLV